MAARIQYRKLPGHRRGLFRSANVWLGADHLLLVRSLRFREEYKRYQLRDIQAIVFAEGPRFHISTRALGIAILWLLAFFFASLMRLRFSLDWVVTLLWLVAGALVVAWVIVSWKFSCRCRIYTAVSRDELPSLYRTWTARRFLREVKPLIQQAQGTIEGAWAEAVENKYIGPAEGIASGPAGAGPGAPARKRTRSLASDVLIASLFGDALLNAFYLHSNAGWVRAGNAAVTLLELGGATAVMAQHYRGTLAGAMQKLGIATIAMLGIFYYAQQLVGGFVAGATAAAKHTPVSLPLVFHPLLREVNVVVTALLGLAGLAIMLLNRDEAEKPQIIRPST